MKALQTLPRVTFEHEGAIVVLWNSGLDTFEIANRIGLHESQVANLLWQLRSAA